MKSITFFLLFCALLSSPYLTIGVNKKTTSKAEIEYTILGDAGSTGTRLYFYLMTNGKSADAAACSLKDKDIVTSLPGVNPVVKLDARLGDALKNNDFNGYAIKIKTFIEKFQSGLDLPTGCTPPASGSTFKYKLLIFSTAGSRVTLNDLQKESQDRTSFSASFKTALAVTGATFTDVAVKVISGRMEGILGFVSLKVTIRKANLQTHFWQFWRNAYWNGLNQNFQTSKIVYYEVGGASSQIVWPRSTSSVHFLERKSSSKGIIKLSKFDNELPAQIYSKSFLGNGGEKTLESAKDKMKLCATPVGTDSRITCLEKVSLHP
jgi:hypothetical protein